MAEVGANFEGIGQDGDWRTPSGRGSALDYRNGTPRARRLFTCRSFRVLEATLLTVLRTLRAEERVGPLWVLVPTNVLCTHLARRFANECGGYANVRFLTLVDFAAEIAEGDLLAGGAGPLPPFFDRALVRSLMRRSGVADTFGHVCQTPGFQQAVLGVLHDLAEARLEPGALRAVAESAPQGSPTREKFFRLADLAEEVRRQRRAIGVFDRSDLLEAASVGLESGRDLPGPLLVYGFYDLTPLQQRLLAAAMARADTVAWMPWDNTPAFAYATPTRTWFQSLGFQIDALPPPEAAASDLGRAQGFVFQAPDYREQRADGSLRVISAPGELREAREVGRAVLRLVAQRGLALDQIGVLMRGAEPYRRLITDQLERAGIPFFCSSRTTLAGTVAGRSLLLLLQIRLENFSRARVVEWLNVAPLHPEHRAVTAASCDRCTRAAGVVAGADEWRVRLARLQERQARAPRDGRDQAGPGADGRRPEDLRRLRAFVEHLLAALERLTDGDRWDVLVPRSIEAYRCLVDAPLVDDVVRAVQHLAALDRVEAGASLPEVAQAIGAVLEETAMPEGRFGGGVFVGDIMQARGLPFRAVVIPGVVEKVLPRPILQDPIVPDDERDVLNQHFGAELALKQRGFDEERLLFALMLGAAAEALVVTFPRLDPATASPRLPSWYLLHLMAAVRGRLGGFSDLERWDRVERVPLSQLFPDDPAMALDKTEFDLSCAAAAVRQRAVDPVRHVFASAFARQAVKAERARAGRACFTPYDGVFAGDASRRILRTGPLRLSPTRIQTYARCPFQYFLRYELGLEPLVDPEQVVTLASNEVGSLVHRILHGFFAAAAGAVPLDRAHRAALAALLDEVAERECDQAAIEGTTGIPLLWQRLRTDLGAAMHTWLDDELGRIDGFRPVALELAFGGRDTPVEIALDRGRSVQLSGRIDRIDFHPDGRARVIDYKTGRRRRVATEEVEVESIQLPMYLFAGRRLYPERCWTAACFAPIPAAARPAASCFVPADWPQVELALAHVVGAVADGIGNGVFPAGKPTCRPCAFPSICQGSRAVFARKLADDRAHLWRGLGAPLSPCAAEEGGRERGEEEQG